MPEIRLKIYRSPTEFLTQTYRQARVTVGRDINNDIVVPAKDVSRFHCLFECTEEGWRVIDLESTNGTYVNGICVKKAAITSGDVIVIGSTRLHVLECPAATPLAALSLAGYRLIQTFDARGLVGKGKRAAERRADRPAVREGGKGDITPVVSFPKPLTPLLTSEEILAAATDPTQTARLVAARLFPLVEADACVIYLKDPRKDRFERAAVEPVRVGVAIPPELLEHVAKRKHATHVRAEKFDDESGRPRSIMCAPMIDGKQLFGAMALVRMESPWEFGDPDLERLAVAALGAAAALSCARAYSRLERAYLDLLDASESLPASIAEIQQTDADAIVLESSVEKLRAQISQIAEKTAALAEKAAKNEPADELIPEIAESVERSEELARQLLRLTTQVREERGESWPAVLLRDLLPLLRDIGGAEMRLRDRIAEELPPVAVSPRVLRLALVRILLFCRDRMHAVRTTISAETIGLEKPLPVNDFATVEPGHYVRLSIEAEGGSEAFEELRPLRDDDLVAEPRDLRKHSTGLFWAERALRRAAARLVVRRESDRAIGFDIYMPIVTPAK